MRVLGTSDQNKRIGPDLAGFNRWTSLFLHVLQ